MVVLCGGIVAVFLVVLMFIAMLPPSNMQAVVVGFLSLGIIMLRLGLLSHGETHGNPGHGCGR